MCPYTFINSTLATWCEELTNWERPWCWENKSSFRYKSDHSVLQLKICKYCHRNTTETSYNLAKTVLLKSMVQNQHHKRLVWKEDSWALPQNYWVKLCILTRKLLFLCILKFDENSSRRASIICSLHTFIFKMTYLIVFKCISFCVCACMCSSVMSESVTPCPAAPQAPVSMGFSSQEYRSKLPFPPPGDLSKQGWKPCLLHRLHWHVASWPPCPLGTSYLCFQKFKAVHMHISTHT